MSQLHHTAFLILMTLLGFSLQGHALEHWFIPNERELKTIQVTNRSQDTELFWLSGPIHAFQEPMEHSFEIAPSQTIEIPLNEYADWSWAHIKAQTGGVLRVQVQTIYEKPFTITSGPSSHWKGRARANSTALVLNQGVLDQTVTLSNSATKKTFTVPGLKTLRIPLTDFTPASMVEIEGDGRISALVIASDTSRSMSPVDSPKILKPAPSETSAYFQVSNSLRTQSFVVEISNPNLIAAARKQLQLPFAFLPRIVVAQVKAGHGETNRDFSERRKTPWSWHVARVVQFADLASQDCDGSPEMLDEILKPWLNSGTNICFWNYKLSRELTHEEVSTGVLVSPPTRIPAAKPSRTSKRPDLEFLRPLR